MRIHSNILTQSDLVNALQDAGLTDVWIEDFSVHRSRSHKNAFEVRLAAADKKGRRGRNSGKYGSSGQYEHLKAATYDEHGRWMVKLFERDPDATIGPYKGISDFHRQTRGAFVAAL